MRVENSLPAGSAPVTTVERICAPRIIEAAATRAATLSPTADQGRRPTAPDTFAHQLSTTKMKCLKSVLMTLICILINVDAAEMRLREELQAMAEQIEILKTLHLTDVTRLKREVEELK